MAITALSTIADSTTPLGSDYTSNSHGLTSGQLGYFDFKPTQSGTLNDLYVATTSGGSGRIIYIGIQDAAGTVISYVQVTNLTGATGTPAVSGGALNTPFNYTAGNSYIVFVLNDAASTYSTNLGYGSATQTEYIRNGVAAGTAPVAPVSSMGTSSSGYSLTGMWFGATLGPATGIPSLTLEDKTGTLMAAGTSVSVTVDTTTGTNVYSKTTLTVDSSNKIPVIDLSSAVTSGTIANGDTVNYRVDYSGETTIVSQTIVASPT